MRFILIVIHFQKHILAPPREGANHIKVTHFLYLQTCIVSKSCKRCFCVTPEVSTIFVTGTIKAVERRYDDKCCFLPGIFDKILQIYFRRSS